MPNFKKIRIRIPRWVRRSDGSRERRENSSAEWYSGDRGGDVRKRAERNLDQPCEASKDYEIPCDRKVYEKVWGVDMVREGDVNKRKDPPGSLWVRPASGENYGRGEDLGVRSWSREQVMGLVRSVDRDLWVRINAWAGSWRRGVETAGRRSVPSDAPGGSSTFERPSRIKDAIVADSKTGLTLPHASIEKTVPDCEDDNLSVTRGNEAALRENYGSYLPSEESPCGGEDQVRCKSSRCRLEHIWRVTDSSGGLLPMRVKTDSGDAWRRINTAGGFGVRFNPNQEGDTSPWYSSPYSSGWGQHVMHLCIYAYFRCVPPKYVIYPSTVERTLDLSKETIPAPMPPDER